MPNNIVLTNPTTMAAPGGHYSHAVTANGFIFIAGQLPIAADGTKLADASFEQQAQQTLDNIASALGWSGHEHRSTGSGARIRHRHQVVADLQCDL